MSDGSSDVCSSDLAGLDPAAVAVVGDSRHDLEMGRRAGCGLLVGVLTGTSSRDDLAPHAHHVIDSIAELEALMHPLSERKPTSRLHTPVSSRGLSQVPTCVSTTRLFSRFPRLFIRNITR